MKKIANFLKKSSLFGKEVEVQEPNVKIIESEYKNLNKDLIKAISGHLKSSSFSILATKNREGLSKHHLKKLKLGTTKHFSEQNMTYGLTFGKHENIPFVICFVDSFGADVDFLCVANKDLNEFIS